MSATVPPNGLLPETLHWSAESIARIAGRGGGRAPTIDPRSVRPVSPEYDVWDAWPLADARGQPVAVGGGELWFALAAERSADPEVRHALARIHQFHREGDSFRHLGRTLPEPLSPGGREWSGSARLDGDRVMLFFTAAGERGEAPPSYRQRIFAAECRFSGDVEAPFGQWKAPREIVAADGVWYRPADEAGGRPGAIKAFRDPAYFHDEDGAEYLLFTGSSAQRPSAHDGVIGLARRDAGGAYALLPPLLEACGVNNELERAHIVRHGGLLYLFWSTQRGVFAPGIVAPTGLYGAVAERIAGPWRLLNDDGLVVANPALQPTQAYSWWVLPDLTVTSFVDYLNPAGTEVREHERRAYFGGTFAPFLKLALHRDSAGLAGA